MSAGGGPIKASISERDIPGVNWGTRSGVTTLGPVGQSCIGKAATRSAPDAIGGGGGEVLGGESRSLTTQTANPRAAIARSRSGLLRMNRIADAPKGEGRG